VDRPEVNSAGAGLITATKTEFQGFVDATPDSPVD
jgi:hypothetical protein